MFGLINTRSEFSLLKGIAKIDALVKTALEAGYGAVGLADGPAMYGTLDFYQACQKAKIKPIISLRVLLGLDLKGQPVNLPVLGVLKSNHAYKRAIIYSSQVMRLASEQNREPTKTALPIENLSAQDDITWILDGSEFESLYCHEPKILFSALEKLQGLSTDTVGFGYDCRLDPDGKIQRFANSFNLNVIAAPAVDYLSIADREAYLVCQAIREKTTIDHIPQLLAEKALIDVKTLEADYSEIAKKNLAKLIESCNLDIPLNQWKFPNWTSKPGMTIDEELKDLTFKGAAQKLGEMNQETIDRLNYELKVISDKGYSAYFLVVSDIINAAKAKKISTTTRGSAAGSLVSFCLGITTVNPLTYGLPFERFLNPFRPSLPDIDMDFADNRRHEVLDYVKNKYGIDHVAQIGTFGTMQARAVVRDVGRALGFNYSFCDSIAKQIPLGKQGFPMTLERALDESPGLREQYATNADVERLIDLSKKLEGNARHTSVHAAGVVISPTVLTDFVPLQPDPETGQLVTQYDMTNVELGGLVKMDFLGIRNLTIMEKTVELVEQRRHEKIDLDNLPIDDDLTFKKIAAGETSGLFQLNGNGITKYLKELKPTRIEDIMIMVALYRPGPIEVIPEYIRRKNGQSPIKYPHQNLASSLDTSLGLMVYQDDIIFAALYVAGYNWEEADKFRKAVGKKIPEEMAKQKIKFYQGCKDHSGMTEKDIDALWKLIEPFAAYGFNKAHAASYGMFAYQTAYLKAHYPEEYLVAVLNSDIGEQEKTHETINECRRLGFKILPVCVNRSQAEFVLETEPGNPKPAIRTGLLAVKNVGAHVIEELIKAREKQPEKKFRNLSDFLTEMQGRDFNKKSLESLIMCGALSTIETNWGQIKHLMENLDSMLDWHKRITKKKSQGQSGLFSQIISAGDIFTLAPEIGRYQNQDLSAWEWELLGFYAGTDPLKSWREFLPLQRKTIAEAKTLAVNTTAILAVKVSDTRTIRTKAKNEPMLVAVIQDESGQDEVVIFPKSYEDQARMWIKASNDASVLLTEVKISHRDNEVKLVVQKTKPLSREPSNKSSNSQPTISNSETPNKNHLPDEKVKKTENPKPKLAEINPATNLQTARFKITRTLAPKDLEQLKKICRAHPGTTRVSLEFTALGRIIETEERVAVTPELRRQLQQRFGMSIA